MKVEPRPVGLREVLAAEQRLHLGPHEVIDALAPRPELIELGGSDVREAEEVLVDGEGVALGGAQLAGPAVRQHLIEGACLAAGIERQRLVAGGAELGGDAVVERLPQRQRRVAVVVGGAGSGQHLVAAARVLAFVDGIVEANPPHDGEVRGVSRELGERAPRVEGERGERQRPRREAGPEALRLAVERRLRDAVALTHEDRERRDGGSARAPRQKPLEEGKSHQRAAHPSQKMTSVHGISLMVSG